jgi:hypothetical protein
MKIEVHTPYLPPTRTTVRFSLEELISALAETAGVTIPSDARVFVLGVGEGRYRQEGVTLVIDVPQEVKR